MLDLINTTLGMCVLGNVGMWIFI